MVVRQDAAAIECLGPMPYCARPFTKMESAVDEKQVGGEVDAYCTKCKMILAHTVLAKVETKIARVRCNTCMGEHAYRANPPGTRKAATAKKKAPGSKATVKKAEAKPFDSLFTEKSLASAQPYSPKGRYAQGDVLQHPTFGVGLVESIRDDKVDAIFRQGPKTLIHTSGATPVIFEKTPRGDGGRSTSSADKPPPGERAGLHVVNAEPLTELPKAAEE